MPKRVRGEGHGNRLRHQRCVVQSGLLLGKLVVHREHHGRGLHGLACFGLREHRRQWFRRLGLGQRQVPRLDAAAEILHYLERVGGLSAFVDDT